MTPTPIEIDAICDLVQQLCGVTLDTSKSYLIESRFGPLLKKENLSTYADLVQRARSLSGGQVKQQIIDAITTQETLFFRDNAPFEALRYKALPELFDAKAETIFPKRLRIWSAASSTGQEPYSLAMTLHEMLPDIHSWDIQIIATDICGEAIAKASRGWYSNLEMDRGVPDAIRRKYFTSKDGGWQLNDSVRALVSFRRLNLLEPFPQMNSIDVLFCRNVAIYFEKEKREDLFRRFKKAMSRDAYLFVGASESLMMLGPEFQPHSHCRSTFYRPNLLELAHA